MKTFRSTLTLVLLVVLCSVTWAAKKQQPAPHPKDAVSQTEPSKAVTSRKSVAPANQALTQPDAAVEITPVPTRPAPNQATGAAAYQIPWQSVNGGGAPSTSTNYQVNASVGQSSIGYATSTNYEAGIGYWYGASAAGGGCSCPHQCDYDDDGFLTALDLSILIDVLFAGTPEITDPGCPTSRGDFDCDGFPTALDLGQLIDHLFAGGDPPCDPCNP